MTRRPGQGVAADLKVARESGWVPLRPDELLAAVQGCPKAQGVFESERRISRNDLLKAFVDEARVHAYPEPLGAWAQPEVRRLSSVLARQVWLAESGGRRIDDECDRYAGASTQVLGATDCSKPVHENHPIERRPGVSIYVEVAELVLDWVIPLASANQAILDDLRQQVIQGRVLPSGVKLAIKNLTHNYLGAQVNEVFAARLESLGGAEELVNGRLDSEARIDLLGRVRSRLLARLERHGVAIQAVESLVLSEKDLDRIRAMEFADGPHDEATFLLLKKIDDLLRPDGEREDVSALATSVIAREQEADVQAWEETEQGDPTQRYTEPDPNVYTCAEELLTRLLMASLERRQLKDLATLSMESVQAVELQGRLVPSRDGSPPDLKLLAEHSIAIATDGFKAVATTLMEREEAEL